MDVAISDADLVGTARAGDAASFGTLLERHRASLYASALSILGERGEAQDAVQDAFLIALQRLADLREPTAAAAWLHAIVRNACRMRLRASRETPSEILTLDRRDELDPEDALERLALRDWVWTALERLPESLRATIMLRYFTRRCSYAEIGAILGIPIGTVRSRLNQAKRRLADALLKTSAAAHGDHGGLVKRRRRELTVALDQMEREGSAALYVADCSPDVLVEVPSRGSRVRGAVGERRHVEDGLAAGVRLRLTGIVASPGITIVEADYRNPREDPHHCPPNHTEIRIHPKGRTTRWIVYFGHRDGGMSATSGERMWSRD
jgi:RNA polymerase sigma factor (sigma-70 family)